MEDLPNDVLQQILFLLSFQDLHRVSSVSRHFRSLASVVEESVWGRVEERHARPGRITPHTSCVIDNLVWCIDDEVPEKKKGRFFVYDLKRGDWESVACFGDLPTPRAFHTISAFGKEIWLFEGLGHDASRMKKYENMAFVLDTDSRCWKEVSCQGDRPSFRWGHSVTVINNQMWIIGGVSPEGYLNEVFMFNPVSREWREAVCKGTLLSGRSGHSATSLGSKIVIVGGGNFVNFWNDVYILDTETRMWSSVQTSGDAPIPGVGHAAASSIDGTQLALFGGVIRDATTVGKYGRFRGTDTVYLLDLRTGQWTMRTCAGTSPPLWHGTTCFLINSHLWVFASREGVFILRAGFT